MESAKVQNENMDFKGANNYFFRQNNGKRICYRCDSETHLATRVAIKKQRAVIVIARGTWQKCAVVKKQICE